MINVSLQLSNDPVSLSIQIVDFIMLAMYSFDLY